MTPNIGECEHEDETEHKSNTWSPLKYFEQYNDEDLMKMISDCSNTMSL